MQRLVVAALLGALPWLYSAGHEAARSDELSLAESFPASLHATRAGKHHWYGKKEGGFEALGGVPYEALACRAIRCAERCAWLAARARRPRRR